MNFELAKRLTKITQDCGIKKIFIIGGEPTIWKHLLDFNKFCNDIGIKTVIVTNALQFSDDLFWNKYTKNPNDSAGISLKAFDTNSYKKVTGLNNFQSIITGLKRAVEFFDCGVSAVSSCHDSEELIKLTEFAKYIGTKHLNIGFCTPIITKNGPDSSFMVAPEKIVRNVLRTYKKINEMMGEKISFSMKLPLCIWPKKFIDELILKKQISTSCQLHNRSGVIFGLSGEVILCNTLFEYPVGKIDEDFSSSEKLIEFLNTSKIKTYYRRLNNYPSEKCSMCHLFFKMWRRVPNDVVSL